MCTLLRAVHAFTLTPSNPKYTVSPTSSTARRTLFRSSSAPAGTSIVRFAESIVSNDDDKGGGEATHTILCDLQTLLKLTGIPQSGEATKVMIQSGQCLLNGVVEQRRAKKLFAGDIVTFNNKEYSVHALVEQTGYIYQAKLKKNKPAPSEQQEFGGRYRSEQWRQNRMPYHFLFTVAFIGKHEICRPPICLAAKKSPLTIKQKERAQYLKQALLWNTTELDKTIAKCPKLVTKSEVSISLKLQFLKDRLSLDDEALSKLVKQQPSLLSLSIEDNLEPKLVYLQERLDLDDEALSKLVRWQPGVLSFSIEDNVEPKLVYLQERLDLNDEALSKLVRQQPGVLNFSIQDNVKSKLVYLQERLVLNDEALSKLVRRQPGVLSLSIEDNVEPTLVYLQERLVLNDEALSKLVRRQPSLLNMAIENNLEPTIDFFESMIGVDESRCMIASNPSVLSSSLEKRLKPRLKDVLEAKIPVDARTASRMAKYTPEQWSTSIAFQKKKLLLSRGEIW